MEHDVDRGQVPVDEVEVVERAQEVGGDGDDPLLRDGAEGRERRAVAALEHGVGLAGRAVDTEAVGRDEARVGEPPQQVELRHEVRAQLGVLEDLAGEWHRAC